MLIKKSSSYWIYIFLTVWVFMQLWTLSSWPVPWFDETYLASVTSNFVDQGSFIGEATSYARYQKEALSYGPVFFSLNGLMVKSFGWSPFVFRLLPLLFGMGVIAIAYKILKQQEEIKYGYIFIVLLCTDPFFNYCIHHGRMDAIALFFALTSIYFLNRKSESKNVSNFLFAGFFLALTALTTPRAVIILIPFFLFFYRVAQKEGIQKMVWVLLIWSIPILVLYSLWIGKYFGGLGDYIAYYTQVQKGNTTSVHGFLGPNFYIPKHEYVLIITALLVFFLSKRKKHILNYWSIFALICFYTLVYDWGIYSIYIIPIYYLLIFNNMTIKRKAYYVLLPLLCFNVGLFGLKMVENIMSKSTKNHHSIAQFLDQNIPEGSNVVGSPLYYYAAKQAKVNYQFYDKYNSHKVRFDLLKNKYGYEYVMVEQKRLQQSDKELGWYLEGCIPIDTFFVQPSKIYDLLFISKVEKDGYNGVLFKLNKK